MNRIKEEDEDSLSRTVHILDGEICTMRMRGFDVRSPEVKATILENLRKQGVSERMVQLMDGWFDMFLNTWRIEKKFDWRKLGGG